MTKQHVRLNTGAVFLRCAGACFIVLELVAWQRVRRIPVRPNIRLVLFLFRRWATPRSILYSLMFAVLATFFLELLVRLVLRPLVRYWHAPWTDGSAGLFHLSAKESVIDSSSARRSKGWQWPAGTLVRTNLRLWFIPSAHDDEIWSRPLDALQQVRLEPAPRIAWGYITDWPERFAFQTVEGDHLVFAVPDAAFVRSWFPPAPAIEASQPATSPFSTTRSL